MRFDRHFFTPTNGIQYLTLSLFVVMAGAIVLGLHRLHEVQRHQNDALSSLICRAEHVVKKTPTSPQFTRRDKEKALRFYESAQKSSHLSPCR